MPDEDTAGPKPASWGALVRLWLLLFLSYATLKVIFNIVYLGIIDLRPVFAWEALTLPIGQSVIVWLVARGRRQRAAVAPVATPSSEALRAEELPRARDGARPPRSRARGDRSSVP